MAERKKLFDRKKRRARKSRRRAVRTNSTIKTAVGRSGTDRRKLIHRRDVVLQLLVFNWERIGWRLSRADSAKALRKALRPAVRNLQRDYPLSLFLRDRTLKATPKEIRATDTLRGREAENHRALQQECAELGRQYDQACAVADQECALNQAIWSELKRRGNETEEKERQFFASKCSLEDLEEKLADQQAYFIQSQFLSFLARGYAHNPLIFANAIAGLPAIGCRRSLALCSGQRSTLWPSYRHQIFEVLERTWERREPVSSRPLAEQFRSAILKLPRTLKATDTNGPLIANRKRTIENHVRTYLCENWRYLRLALERLRILKLKPSAAPYVIASSFYRGIGRPRTAEEQLLVEAERISN